MRRRNGRSLAGGVCRRGQTGVARAGDTQQEYEGGGCEQGDNSYGSYTSPPLSSNNGNCPAAAWCAVLAVGVTLGCVVTGVAFLAERGQIVVGVVSGIVVEVGGGEDDFAAGLGMGLAVGGSAPFAVALGALRADALADLVPVGRV